jgi:anoctamin-1
MSFIYKLVTTWATEWENYPTQTRFENSLSLKFIFFEFINNYSALIYIAFFKDGIEKCADNNCNKELNIQIYMILATNLAINLVELGSPYIMMFFQKKKYIDQTTLISGGKIVTCEPYSPQYQNLCNEYNTTMYDYIEIIILFGYVSLFSVACPLTPLLVMILLYFEKFVDTCKLFFLSRVTLNDKADGIEVFRLIFKIIYFIGMVNSIALVLFTQQTGKKYNLITKIVIFAGVENLILIMMMTLKFNKLPDWFENVTLIKDLYMRKFVNKQAENLPHHFLKGDRSINFIKEKVDDDNADVKETLVENQETKQNGIASNFKL